MPFPFRRHKEAAASSEAEVAATPATHDGARTPRSLAGSQNVSPSSSTGSMPLLQRKRASEIMARHLFDLASSQNWINRNNECAVGIRWDKDLYVVEPALLQSQFHPVLQQLNCGAALTFSSPVVEAIIYSLSSQTAHVQITATEKIQVLESYNSILAGEARRAQNAAFVIESRTLLLWADNAEALEQLATVFAQNLIRFVWASASNPFATPRSNMSLHSPGSPGSPGEAASPGTPRSPQMGDLTASDSENSLTKQDIDTEEQAQPVAQTMMMAPLLEGLSVALTIVICGNFARQIVSEFIVDGDAMRLVLLVSLIPVFFVLLFFSETLITTVAQVLAPIRPMAMNTRFYSGKAPQRLPAKVQLPHITVQMPVYKESLKGVIIPTLDSLKKAVSTYERQGGTASIIISEDGINALDGDASEERIRYYEEHDVSWVARPKHGESYERAGKFKKASNLNFTCDIAMRVEKILSENEKSDESAESRHLQALQQALAEAHPEARGSGDIRFGDFVLLVDADTRVPADCLLDAASEMLMSPEVAVLQHCSGIMIISNSYFEHAFAYFTKMVNFTISWKCASGQVAPFMGHNAYLRWSSLVDAAIQRPDGSIHIWDETTVSEDFDLAIRLLCKGYTTRWATYSNWGYMEGVSLTSDDEVNRWRKYAFGVYEIMFNPLMRWPTRGPLSPRFRKFLWSSCVPTHYKLATLGYIFSYLPVACALPWAFGLYLLQGWFYPVLDPAFFQPYQAWLAVIVVFVAGGFLGTAVARHRAKDANILSAALEHLRWAPLMVLYFGGLSYHVLTATSSFFFSLNVTFAATSKDVEDSNFFLEVPAIVRKHWRPLLLNIFIVASIIVLSLDFLPLEWQIQGFATLWTIAFIAGCHLLFDIVLNPALLRFSF